MTSQFELREVGTRRLLGTLEMVDVLPPGAVVQLFRDNLVQVDDPSPPAPAATVEASDIRTPARKGKRTA